MLTKNAVFGMAYLFTKEGSLFAWFEMLRYPKPQ
jgi:hypothetical protein